MISQSTGHRRSQQHLTAYTLDLGGPSAQFVMGPAEIVGTAKQPHPAFQRRQPPGRVPTFARQAGEALAHGSVETLNKGGVERCSSVRSRKQGLSVLQCSLVSVQI
jgi:hypothetical protein